MVQEDTLHLYIKLFSTVTYHTHDCILNILLWGKCSEFEDKISLKTRYLLALMPSELVKYISWDKFLKSKTYRFISTEWGL